MCFSYLLSSVKISSDSVFFFCGSDVFCYFNIACACDTVGQYKSGRRVCQWMQPYMGISWAWECKQCPYLFFTLLFLSRYFSFFREVQTSLTWKSFGNEKWMNFEHGFFFLCASVIKPLKMMSRITICFSLWLCFFHI